jgi:cytochrome o ubiquinol oxidase operon protein cyoD
MSKLIPKQSTAVTVWLYVTGFILAVGLTVMAYVAVTAQLFTNEVAILILMGLAVIQFVVQLIFFLHIGQESKPRWNLAAFLFTLLVLIVIVFGSLWIMYNLNYGMGMSSEQMDEFMIKQSDKGF